MHARKTTVSMWQEALASTGLDGLQEVVIRTLTPEKALAFSNALGPHELEEFIIWPDNVRQQEILGWLDNYQLDRFAAEPVYGPTGKGFLESKGVSGLEEEQKLQAALQTPGLSAVLTDFCALSGINVIQRLESLEAQEDQKPTANP